MDPELIKRYKAAGIPQHEISLTRHTYLKTLESAQRLQVMGVSERIFGEASSLHANETTRRQGNRHDINCVSESTGLESHS